MKPTRVFLLLATAAAFAACAERAAVDPAAEEQYQQGMAVYLEGGEANLRQAIEHFTQAVEIDTTFARGYAGLSRAYAAIGGNYNILAPEESWPQAKSAADRALALDEDLADAHLAHAYVLEGRDWDWAGADMAYQRALELDSTNAEILLGYAWFLYGTGRLDDASVMLAQAGALEPSAGDPFLRFVVTGDADEAIDAANALIASTPDNPYGYWVLALIQTWEGDYAAAAQALQQQIPLMDGDVVDEVALLGFVYGRMGQEANARGMLQRLDRVAAAGRYVSPVLKGWIYSGLGDRDSALLWVQRGYEVQAHRSGLGLRIFGALFEPIRDDPRFSRMLEEMGLLAQR